MRSAVVVFATLVLVLVFLVSAVAKLRDLDEVATAAAALGVPEALAVPVSRLLPPAELAVSVALAVGIFASPVRRIGAALGIGLLAAFTIAMVRTLRRGQAPNCRCFGSISDQPIGSDAIVRNVALGALALVSAIG